MAATPKYGQMLFRTMSGRTIAVDLYVSDVANALIRFDGGAGSSSSSPDYWIAPEKCVLVDYSQVTGTADTTKMRLCFNGVPTASLLRYDIHVSTNSNRPVLSYGLNAGTRLTAIQLA